MSERVHIKQNLSHAVKQFKTYPKDTITLRLGKQELASLINMIDECQQFVSDDDSETEVIILKEIKQLLTKKYFIISNRANVPLLCSQARTLFIWLNENHFAHPIEESFSATIVNDIYKQVIR